MVEVQRVAALIAREATSNIVNPRQSHPVCSCVGSRASRLRRAAFCITEQAGGTPTLWEKGRREKRAVTHRNCGRHRNVRPVQISEKRGFGCNVGITARAAL